MNKVEEVIDFNLACKIFGDADNAKIQINRLQRAINKRAKEIPKSQSVKFEILAINNEFERLLPFNHDDGCTDPVNPEIIVIKGEYDL